MKASAKASAPAGDKAALPLRGTTVLRSPATNRATPGGAAGAGGFDSIRLNTYYDSSGLKAALRELEAAFAAPDRTSATSSSPPTAPVVSTSFTTAREESGDGASGRGNAAAPRDRATSTVKPTITVVGQTRTSSSSPPPFPPRKRTSGPSSFMQLPPQLMLHCFSFCDLKALGVLCSVSVRLNVIVEQQGHALWAAAAQRRRIPVATPAASRAELERALEQRAQAQHAEEAFYESEIARMEERLRARAEDVYTQNVDVNRTIATGGDSGSARGETDVLGTSADASAAPPYWLRHQGLDGGPEEAGTREMKSSTLTQLCTKLRAEIEALAEAKRLCECKVSLHEDSLRQQEAQLQQWQAFLTPSVAAARSSEAAGAVSTQATTTPLITAAQLEQFERRIARLVLNGSITTSTPQGGDAMAADIPFVFRRGVEDFASLELVLRSLGVNADNAASFVQNLGNQESQLPGSTADEEGGCFAVTTRIAAEAPSLGARNAGKRWRAFQQVCPVNEEYGNVRCYLKLQELRAAALTSDGGLQPSGGGGRPSTKQIPALLRLSGFVRRVEAMTDSQVLQAWM